MVTKAEKLDALAEVANIKAEQELKKYAAFRMNMQVLGQRADDLERQVHAVYNSGSPTSVAQLRVMADQSHRLTQNLLRTEAEIAQLRPRFEALRQQAVTAWGRVEVLRGLAEKARLQARHARQRKARGLDSG